MAGPWKSTRTRFVLFTLMAAMLLLAIPAYAAAAADTYEPDNVIAEAKPLVLDTPQSHTISPAGEGDWVSLAVEAGQSYEIKTYETPGMGNFDTVLTVWDSTGTSQLYFNDDGNGIFSKITFVASATETMYAHVRCYYNWQEGFYDLNITKVGSIAGTVTGGPGSEPVQNCPVYAGHVVSEDWGDSVQWDNSGLTDADGEYAIPGLPPRDYVVFFGGTETYTGEWYDDVAGTESSILPDGVDTVPVANGAAVTGIDAQLAENGSISGTVTNEADPAEPLSGLAVYTGYSVPDPDGDYFIWSGSSYTDEFGAYTVSGLPARDYNVYFSGSADYIGEWWDGVADTPEEAPPAEAGEVTVAEGSDTPGIDASLSSAGHIAGTVTDEWENPLSAIVYAGHMDEGGLYWDANVYTNEYGVYDVGGLTPGEYIVWFAGNESYIPEYWNDSVDLESATPVAVVGGETTGDINAALAETGGISGYVHDNSDNPLSSYVYTAYVDDGSLYWDNYSWTDGSGGYYIGGLYPRDYYVYFEGDWEHAGEWYGGAVNRVDSTIVSVSSGITSENIDATLDLKGGISGTVTGGSEPAPVVGSNVYIGHLDSDPLLGEGWYWDNGVTTDDAGQYSCDYLSPRDYKVYFEGSAGFVGEWYDDAATQEDAAWVTVTDATTTTGIDAVLSTGGSISGTVTGGTPASGVSGCFVEVGHWVSDPDWGDYVEWDNGQYTDGDGAYTVTGLGTGDYVVLFESTDRFIGEWYDDVRDPWDATLVSVTLGEDTSGIDAVLAEAARITGTVTGGALDEPIADCLVEAGHWVSTEYGDEYVADNYTWTDEYGTYDLGYLPAGDEFVFFGGSDAYVAEWYDDAKGTDGGAPPADADPIALAEGQTVSDVNANLAEAGLVSGTVTGGDPAEPVFDTIVEIGHWEGGDFYYDSYGWTDEFGAYSIGGLAAGEYYVRFSGNDQYLAEWYDDAPAPDTSYPPADADAVTVVGGESTTGIDAVLATAGRISGTVTAGDPAEGLWDSYVNVVHWESTPDGQELLWDGDAWTDEYGDYTVGGLAAGEYLVYFGGNSAYLGEWYDNVRGAWGAPPEDATPVAVAAGEDVTGIDAFLEDAGRISGTVTGGDAAVPVEDCMVIVGHMVNDPDVGEQFVWDDYTWTDLDGAYGLGGLATGDYLVFFGGTDQFAPEWFDGVAGIDWSNPPANATVVEVTEGETTTDINANLSDAGHITGTVTGPTGDPLAEGWAVAWVQDGDEWTAISGWELEPDGTYDIPGLAAGTYRVGFEGIDADSGRWCAPEFYDDAQVVEIATDIDVAAGQTVTDIDAQLGEGATINGTVSFDAAAAEEVRVEFWLNTGASGWLLGGSTYMESDHTYSSYGLQPGEYKVRFTDEYPGDYPAIYYDTKATLGTATSVSVGAGEDATADQQLDSLGPAVSSDAAGPYSGWADIALTATDEGVGVASISYRLDGGTTVTVAGAATSVYVPEDAEHSLTFWAVDKLGNVGQSETVQFAVTAGETVYTTVAGTGRIQTAVKASQEAFPDGLDPAGARTVVIATAMNWPDALGGTALAGVLDGPILLTSPNALPADVTAEITRLGATKAIILGGTGAVSTSVQTALGTQLGSGNVERIDGLTRYLTADKIAARVISEVGDGWDGTMFVATGGNFPDALAVAPIAAAKGCPLVLAHPTLGLSTGTKDVMADASDIYILGGVGAVSAAVETGLNTTFGDANVTRLSGSDRYATAVAIAQFGVDECGLGWNKVAITTGQDFPDALAGGVLQGKDGSVMLLTPSASLAPAVTTVLTANKDVISEVRFLGGTGAVSTAVRNQIALLLQ